MKWIIIIVISIAVIRIMQRMDKMALQLAQKHDHFHVGEVSWLYESNRIGLLESAIYKLKPKHSKELSGICESFQKQDSIFRYLLDNDSTVRINKSVGSPNR